MTLLVCPDCRHSVSDRATSCPGCHCPLAGAKRGPSSTPETIAATIFFGIAGALTLIGFYTMFTYQATASDFGDPGPGQIVGGDAYNYIIIAVRGVGFIAAGGVSALVGVGALLSGILSRTRP